MEVWVREAPRVFIHDAAGNWTELSTGWRRTLRLSAPNLSEARRRRDRLPRDVSVILDVTVSVADDSRAALAAAAVLDHPHTVRYAGTVDGLAGLVADLYTAGVADGVTLLPAASGTDLRSHGVAALPRIHRLLRIPA